MTDCYEGCSCQTDCCSGATNCPCVTRYGPAYDIGGRLLETESQTGMIRPVVECGDECSCSMSCFNRVVQHGVTVSLQVFAADNKGVGVRTLHPLSRGTFVCEYAGEILSKDDAARRAGCKDLTRHNYLLAVREFFDAGRKSSTTFVDATYVGNVGRLINHSCEPNLFVQPVRVGIPVPTVALFALTDIAADAELTYDYSGGTTVAVEYDSSGTCRDLCEHKKPCLCGSESCRLLLPYDASIL